jgi:pimeloyl-ACP methyl ester carboxylesterase
MLNIAQPPASVEGGVMVRSIALPTGVTLQYAEQGSESGIPVVFLHGVTDSWRSFEPVFEYLPPGMRLLALTQRGHGESSKPAAGYGYTDMARDLRAFMDALAIPAAVIVGHSMGSLVAQRFAADDPDRVAGLVLMGAFRTIHGDAGLQEFWDSTVSRLEDPVDVEVIRDFQVSTLAREVPADFLEGVIRESQHVPAYVWKAAFAAFLGTPDFTPELARLTAPVLVAWGDRDAFAPRADQEALVARMPGARLLVYAGGGHAFHWEDPGRFAMDLLDFVYARAGVQ